MLDISETAPEGGALRIRTLYPVKRLKAETLVLHIHSVGDLGQWTSKMSKQDGNMVITLVSLALTG